ncbi:MAG: hypothetical protein ACJAXK_001226 [Yoonia sp.]|jgi:hypothetical protein
MAAALLPYLALFLQSLRERQLVKSQAGHTAIYPFLAAAAAIS